MDENETVRAAMRILRGRVKPENCARDPKAMRKAQKASVAARRAKKKIA